VSNNGKFLSSLYRDETLTLIIEEAINGKFQLMFIDRNKGVECVLSRGDLIYDIKCEAKKRIAEKGKSELAFHFLTFHSLSHLCFKYKNSFAKLISSFLPHHHAFPYVQDIT
jgi:hypothetical protein